MASKHTPGPWSAEIQSYAIQVWTKRDNRDDEDLVVELDSHPESLEGAFANALLIAAAPELLETVQSTPIISKYHGTKGFEVERFITDYEAWRTNANIIIIKATAGIQ